MSTSRAPLASALLAFLVGGATGAMVMREEWPASGHRGAEARDPSEPAALSARTDATAPSATEPPVAPPTAVDPASTSLAGGAPLRFLAVGGGAGPHSTEVQLEQDVALFVRVASDAAQGAGGVGAIYFGGGRDARSVQVLSRASSGVASWSAPSAEATTTLRARLGALAEPRASRRAEFRPTRLPVRGPADARVVLAALADALRQPGPRLEVFLATHGEMGERPAENTLAMWGETALDAIELALLFEDESVRRGARFIATACFGGGLADATFVGASLGEGVGSPLRCGLFATDAFHESAGCDPNPERAAQEGYAIHFLEALRGRHRDGSAGSFDLDGDGVVGALEAHTAARIASASIDIPTTTSERFLRAMGIGGTVTARPIEATYPTPEDDAVIAALGEARGIRTESAARNWLAQAERRAADVEAAREEDDIRYREAYWELLYAVFAIAPELDDPYRDDFERVLSRERDALESVFDGPLGRAYADALAAIDRWDGERETLDLERARAARLVRAFETRRLARTMAAALAEGDPSRSRYEALLACERAALMAPSGR